MQIPSFSNTSGTALGGAIGSFILAHAAAWPFVVTIAGVLSTPIAPISPIMVAGMLALGGASVANYAVTHIAEVQNWNELVKEYWPQVEKTYPTDKNNTNIVDH